jgi:uncharacterized DUF497 family protein
VDIEFDPAKDAANIEKHGVSLGRAAEIADAIVIEDERFSDERRFRIYGLIDGKPHCIAATLRGAVVRVISVRRAHEKEYRRYV